MGPFKKWREKRRTQDVAEVAEALESAQCEWCSWVTIQSSPVSLTSPDGRRARVILCWPCNGQLSSTEKEQLALRHLPPSRQDMEYIRRSILGEG